MHASQPLKHMYLKNLSLGYQQESERHVQINANYIYITETAMTQLSKIITRNTVRFCPQLLLLQKKSTLIEWYWNLPIDQELLGT